MNAQRTFAIAANVFREVLRDRVLYLAGLFAVVIVVATLLLPEISAGAEDKIILDVGLAAIDLIGLVVTVFVGTGLINREIEKRTALTLVAKPMHRSEFIVGKHIGLSTVLAVLTAIMTVFYFGVLSLNQIEYPMVSIVTATSYLILQLCLIAAVAILFGVFTNSLIATILTFATYLMGHFSRDLVTLSQLNDSPGVQCLVKGIYLILPDLSRFNLKNDAVYDILPNTFTLLADAGYGLLYTTLLLTLAVWIFSYREF